MLAALIASKNAHPLQTGLDTLSWIDKMFTHVLPGYVFYELDVGTIESLSTQLRITKSFEQASVCVTFTAGYVRVSVLINNVETGHVQIGLGCWQNLSEYDRILIRMMTRAVSTIRYGV